MQLLIDMKNIDVEIYINQLIKFFESNPNDLMSLIGELQKDTFYEKLRERCEQNYLEDKDITLTREQIINVVLELKFHDTPEKEDNLSKIVQKTKFGDIILN